jgi:hypothetical protein
MITSQKHLNVGQDAESLSLKFRVTALASSLTTWRDLLAL